MLQVQTIIEDNGFKKYKPRTRNTGLQFVAGCDLPDHLN